MQKALTLAALIAATMADTSVVADSSDMCVDAVSTDTGITYADVTGADLTDSLSTTYDFGWMVTIAADSSGVYCYHWNNAGDASIDQTSSATSDSIASNSASAAQEVYYDGTDDTCDQPTYDSSSADTSSIGSGGEYTIDVYDASTTTISDTCGYLFYFEWNGATDDLVVTYLSDNAIVGAASAFAVVAIASLF